MLLGFSFVLLFKIIYSFCLVDVDCLRESIIIFMVCKLIKVTMTLMMLVALID